MTRSCFNQWEPSRQRKWLNSLSEAERAALLHDWLFFARDKQLPPPDPWSVWLILSGRGFGKTRTGAQWIRYRQETGLYGRFILIAETAADARDVMVEGESGILACSPPWDYPKYEPSKRRITWPNGATATTFSGDEPDQLRGPQGDSCWADEPAKWRYPEQAWDNMEFGLRLGPNPQVVATTTPRPIPLIRKLIADERTDAHPRGQTVITRGHTDENRENLASVYVDRVIRRYEGTRLGRQELAGEVLDDNPGALWKRAQIDATRVGEPGMPQTLPALARVVVGVDPQAADPKADPDNDNAETGIVACGWNGNRTDPHFFLLGDDSLKDTPGNWGKAVVTSYDRHKADRVIGEQNNGGAMVEFVVTTAARDRGVRLAYDGVHASRGKQTRADPIAGLYEQGRVHHVGMFPILEDQMCSWEPGGKSPDRMDAAVWGLSALAEAAGLRVSGQEIRVLKW